MKSNLVCLIVILNVFFFVNSVWSDVMPVPGDCKKYQMCDYSGCFVFNCGLGTEFNPRVKICDYPLGDRSSCGDRGPLGAILAYPGVQNPTNYYPGNQNPTNYYPGNQNPTNYYPGNQNIPNSYPGNQNPTNYYPGNQNIPNSYPGNQNPTNYYPGNQNVPSSYQR